MHMRKVCASLVSFGFGVCVHGYSGGASDSVAVTNVVPADGVSGVPAVASPRHRTVCTHSVQYAIARAFPCMAALAA